MKKLIILYGEQNAGKTSTLRQLFQMLTGYTLRSRDPKGDLRVVFTVGDKTVYLASYGDKSDIIATNFSFFSGTPHGKTALYELTQEGVLQRIDKQRLQNLNPDICITACRTYTDGKHDNEVYDELCRQIIASQPIDHGMTWVPKLQATGPRRERKTNNQDRETALMLVAEVMKEINI